MKYVSPQKLKVILLMFFGTGIWGIGYGLFMNNFYLTTLGVINICLGGFVGWIFLTQTKSRDKRKKQRNYYYNVCGKMHCIRMVQSFFVINIFEQKCKWKTENMEMPEYLKKTNPNIEKGVNIKHKDKYAPPIYPLKEKNKSYNYNHKR